MENILKRFINTESRIVDRIYCFKYSKYLFWAKKMNDGSIEFWAHSAINNKAHYLGKFHNGQIVECDGFYHHALEWGVQKGALKIFGMRHKWEL